MGTRKLSVGVERLGKRIERWQRAPRRRSQMPEELWTRAVALGRREGAYRVARGVRINLGGLKRRMAASVEAPKGFVELTGAEILGAAPPGTGTVVELSDGTGIRVTVRLPGPVDLTGLVTAFRQRGA